MFRQARNALLWLRRNNDSNNREATQLHRVDQIEPEMASLVHFHAVTPGSATPSSNSSQDLTRTSSVGSSSTITKQSSQLGQSQSSLAPFTTGIVQATAESEYSMTSLKRKRSLSSSSSTNSDNVEGERPTFRRRVSAAAATAAERFAASQNSAGDSSAVEQKQCASSSETRPQEQVPLARNTAPCELSTWDVEVVRPLQQPVEVATQSHAVHPKANRRIRIRRECLACGEETSRQCPFPSQKITSTCDHDASTCKSCLRKWIVAQLDSTTWDSIRCPECSEVLQHNDIQLHASPSVFRRIDNMALASYLSGDETFFHCLAPTCKAGQLHPEGPLEPIFSCAVCKTRSCVACRTLWHDGRTCEEHQQDLKEALDRDIAAKKAEEERKAQEIASEEAIRVLSKVCPNGSCGARIEKNGGCDHMTCGKCHYEFCWVCFVDFNNIRREGNEAHLPDCRWRNPESDPEMMDEEEYHEDYSDDEGSDDEGDEETDDEEGDTDEEIEAYEHMRRLQPVGMSYYPLYLPDLERIRRDRLVREAEERLRTDRSALEADQRIEDARLAREAAERNAPARMAREQARQQMWQRQAQFGASLQQDRAVANQQSQRSVVPELMGVGETFLLRSERFEFAQLPLPHPNSPQPTSSITAEQAPANQTQQISSNPLEQIHHDKGDAPA